MSLSFRPSSHYINIILLDWHYCIIVTFLGCLWFECCHILFMHTFSTLRFGSIYAGSCMSMDININTSNACGNRVWQRALNVCFILSYQRCLKNVALYVSNTEQYIECVRNPFKPFFSKKRKKKTHCFISYFRYNFLTHNKN